MTHGGDRQVYSTDPDFCPVCGRTPCGCGEKSTRRQPEPVRLSFRRGGKGNGVTQIERLNLSVSMKQVLLKQFKKKFGCGGTLKNGIIEIQGDRRAAIAQELASKGYKIKQIG